MRRGAANAGAVRSMYTPMAGAYEEIWAPLLRPFGLRLIKLLPLLGAGRVLDLGCGVGRLLPDIEEHVPGALVVGSDLVEGMVVRAPARFARVVMDATQLGFEDHAFDAVVSAFCLFHLPSPIDALTGIGRVLRPSGGIALAVWGQRAVFSAAVAWIGELDAAAVPPDPVAEGPVDGEALVNSREKLGSVLAAAGFEDVQCESLPWEQPWTPGAFIDWQLRMGPSRRRLDQLDPPDRDRVVAWASKRVASMTAEDLVDRKEVVIASGRSPA